MQRHHDRIEPPLAASAASIGNFDGVHCGHARLLGRLVEHARALGVPPAVVTFQPHPLKILRPDKAPVPITSLDEKARLLERLGVEVLLVLRFDEPLARMEPAAFLQEVIVAQLHPRLVVVGHDFNFGKDRKGTLDLLGVFCGERGIELEVIEPVESEGQRVSSSEIRQALTRGDLPTANALMGHPYRVESVVVEGDRRGRTLGFPTANLQVAELLVPRGVYRGHAWWNGRSGPAAVNVGGRPTFGDGGETLVEVHVLDGRPELYGKRLAVDFLERLRPEMRFAGPEQLVNQIRADVAAVRAAAQSPPAGS
jgi:riboflavin kinase / FMN adenylyltransferase